MNLTKMNEGISVRTCNHKDIDTLVALGIKTFRDTFDEFNSPENVIRYINNTFTKKILEHEMKQPGTVFFLAFDEWRAVGYAKIRRSNLPEGMHSPSALEIERLYAHKQYVGKRVGHLLMQTCIAYARKKDVQTLWLGVWENNARAISFYQKNGFQKFGHHTFMLGDDAQSDWLMKKELS